MSGTYNIWERGKSNLSTAMYSLADTEPHVDLRAVVPDLKNIPTDQYVLRMMVGCPDREGLVIPPSLMWLKESISNLKVLHNNVFPHHPFVYVTVRNGIVKSTTDDVWHVDGFSMRVPHMPEQNYLFCTDYPTEWLDQNIYIPNDFDPMKHNLHWWIQDEARKENKRNGVTGAWMLIDPYVIHRRAPGSSGKFRIMVRVSFVPIEIQDNTCTVNPYMFHRRHYEQEDLRKSLTRYYPVRWK